MVKNFEDMFVHFEYTNTTDGQTSHDGIDMQQQIKQEIECGLYGKVRNMPHMTGHNYYK